MAKVYVVTSGEYSDYGIDSIFSNIEAAENVVLHGMDVMTLISKSMNWKTERIS